MSVTADPATPQFLAPEAKAPRSRRKLAIKIVAGLVGLAVAAIIALVVFVNAATKDAQKVSDQFVAAVQAGDGAKAYDLTSPAFQEATTEAQLTEMVQGLSTLVEDGKATVTAKSIHASTGEGKLAVFVYRAARTGGGSVHFKTQLSKDDGAWHVMNFRSSESSMEADVE